MKASSSSAVAIAVAALTVFGLVSGPGTALAVPGTFTCTETVSNNCPGAPISKNIPNPPGSIDETSSGITAPPSAMIRPGVLGLMETSGSATSSDFVSFKCDANSINCIAFMESDPAEPGEKKLANDAANLGTYISDFLAAVRTLGNLRLALEPNGSDENSTQELSYTANGPGGALTYTIISDVPEPGTAAIISAPLILAGLARYKRRRSSQRRP
jgi:hypothetical protein